jgi:hypothetical protein
MGASTEAIDAISYAGITISRRHLDRQKAIIADEHPNRVASYLQINKNNTMVLNIDDYHNIHAKRMPDTCSTSTVAHMTTLVLNNINSIPIGVWIFDLRLRVGCSLHPSEKILLSD